MARTAALVFVVCGAVLSVTLAPTLKTAYLDSPEFVIGAETLGIAHAPGYPLYLLLAHLFTYLPIGDVAFRVNLFSALALTLTAPTLYLTLHTLVQDRLIAAAAALMTVFTYHVWQTGTAAEVYAPQLLTLALVGYLLVRGAPAYAVGGAYGLALAITPASVLFAPAVSAVLLARREQWPRLFGAGALAALVTVLPWLYFPLRYRAAPAYNAAGTFDGVGAFQPVNLTTLAGVWWLVRGAQFDDLFAWVPTLAQARELFFVFGTNWLWVGLALAAVGLLSIWNQQRRVFAVWWLAFVPFLAFYLPYGAADKTTMLGPGHLLLSVPITYGLAALQLPRRVKAVVLAGGVIALLIINGPALIEQRSDPARTEAAFTLAHLPPEAVVFGTWDKILPLQYLHIVEGQRPDVTLYNLFFFSDESFTEYVQYTAWEQPRPVIFLDQTGNSAAQQTIIEYFVEWEPLDVQGRVIGYRAVRYVDAF